MAIDWLTASVEQRKALYRTMRRLMAEEAMGWNGVYEALGRTVPTGSGYEDNFRAGRVARQTANQIYRWLAQRHPTHAAKLDRELGEEVAAGERWRSFLEKHGRFERVTAVLIPESSIGIVAFAKPEPLARPVIPLGAPFCFEMNIDRDGAVIACQHVDDQWYVMPLRPDDPSGILVTGRQYLPRQANGEPLALSEDVQDGRHSFLFLLGDPALIEAVAAILPTGAIPAATLDRIAQTLEADQVGYTMLRLNLLFVR